MFPWASSNSDYYEDSSHQWTDYHDAVVNHHLKLGEMPHVDTHTKAQAMGWADNIGEYFDNLSVGSLVASLASIFVHHGTSHQEAKQIALELSHHCNKVSIFSSIIGNYWDKYIAHKKSKEVNPHISAARQLGIELRKNASKR